MRLLPKNQTYTSEPLVKTIIAPLFLLLASVAAFLTFLNPFTMPQVAVNFGMAEEASLTVERVEEVNPGANIRIRSWNCDHWVAYGVHDGREIFTRACDSQVPQPTEGESVQVLLAPSGNQAYLLARGDPNSTVTIVSSVILALLVVYGVILSLRLFYIGYSSNWFKKTK